MSEGKCDKSNCERHPIWRARLLVPGIAVGLFLTTACSPAGCGFGCDEEQHVPYHRESKGPRQLYLESEGRNQDIADAARRVAAALHREGLCQGESHCGIGHSIDLAGGGSVHVELSESEPDANDPTAVPKVLRIDRLFPPSEYGVDVERDFLGHWRVTYFKPCEEEIGSRCSETAAYPYSVYPGTPGPLPAGEEPTLSELQRADEHAIEFMNNFAEELPGAEQGRCTLPYGC
jgi:hypothetical protein